MTDCKPKFKFKKPSSVSLKKKHLRRDQDDAAQDVYNSAPSARSSADSLPSADDVAAATSNQGDEDEASALDKILAVERRRKLLFGRNRGVDAANLGKQQLRRKNSEGGEDQDGSNAMVRNKDLEERLKGTFSEGKLAGSNDMGGDDEGGILAKKHKRAMEEFIRTNLQTVLPTDGGGETKIHDEQGTYKFKNAAVIEKELYSELLATSDAVAKEAQNSKKDSLTGDEGDVGAGGTMMGGTGIAEVALPIDERIRALKETERAAIEYERARRARLGITDQHDQHIAPGSSSATAKDLKSSAIPITSSPVAMVPISFAHGPGKRKRKDAIVPEPKVPATLTKPLSSFNVNEDFEFPVQSSAIPAGSFIQRSSDTSNVGASYSHNFALHNREWIEQRKDERQAEIDAITAQREAEEGPEESRARLGFEVARKLAKGEAVPDDRDSAHTSGTKGDSMRNEWDRKQGSNDDRVWKTFMSNQRNRR